MLSKTENKESSVSSSTPPTLVASCSHLDNKINVIDLETKQNYVTFDGARISYTDRNWTHVKEIPNTKLLVSLHHNRDKSANMEIFDISKKGKVNKIYSLGEIFGVVGWGDVTYNSRRNILGAIPVTGRIAYHLFNVDTNASNVDGIVKLNRKSKWHSQYSTQQESHVTGFDFNPAGESIAIIDKYGVCLISDVNTNNYGFHIDFKKRDPYSRCRWSTNIGESLLFVKYDWNELNILDVEKKVLTLTNQIELDSSATHWIDACESNGNLLASGGYDKAIKIFDKRESKVVRTFKGIHPSKEFASVLVVIRYLGDINCVRWNSNADMIASASDYSTAKLLDFKTGKVLYTGETSDENSARSVCFI